LANKPKLGPNILNICCFSIPVESSSPVATANLRRNFTLAIIIGHDYSETLTGGSESDYIDGRRGNDSLFGNFGNDSLHGGYENDSLRGGEGDDSLFGDAGVDALLGDAGNDVLVGGVGFDKLFGGLVGGTEADTFRYLSTADSGVGIYDSFRRDIIYDFVHGQDKIDLEAIDAKARITDDQAFSFIGSAPFTAEGQVRVVTEGDHTLVEMNTSQIYSGTASGADSVIELNGNIDVTATDFVL
jgi:serralysin